MRLTVVICTRNRSELLYQTLEALTGLEVPEGEGRIERGGDRSG